MRYKQMSWKQVLLSINRTRCSAHLCRPLSELQSAASGVTNHGFPNRFDHCASDRDSLRDAMRCRGATVELASSVLTCATFAGNRL